MKYNWAKLKKKTAGIIMTVVIIVIAIIVAIISQIAGKKENNTDPEISKSMIYAKVQEGDERVTGIETKEDGSQVEVDVDAIKFDAFFLRDLNGDGTDEGIRGTCKEVGNEDTLYINFEVENGGILKNAKVEIEGANIYLQMETPKDEEIKENCIGNNIKEIEFNDITTEMNKTITGTVRSGDYSENSKKQEAIGDDESNYSREDNKIILTGIYEDGENKVEIRKEVLFTADWYEGSKVEILNDYSKYLSNQNEEDKNAINETAGIVVGATAESKKIFSEEWAINFGGTGSEEIDTIAVTKDGEYIVGGNFASTTIQVGENQLVNNGRSDGFVIRLDKNGNIKGEPIVIGGESKDEVTTIAVTNDGGFVVGGTFTSSEITIGGVRLKSNGYAASGRTGFIVKYDREGKIVGKPQKIGTQIFNLRATKDGGFVAVGGTSAGSVGFLAKFDQECNKEIEKDMTYISKNSYMRTIAELSNGDFVIGGEFTDQCQIDGITLSSNGDTDGFFVRYDKEWNMKGNPTIIGGSKGDIILTIAETSDGGFVVRGNALSSTIKINETSVNNSGKGYIIKYDKNGNMEYQPIILGGGYVGQTDVIAGTSDGGYIVTGNGNDKIEGYSLSDIFIVKFDKNGKVSGDPVCIKGIRPGSIAKTNDGGFIICGFFSSTMQIGEYTLTNNGSSDGFIAKYKKIKINPTVHPKYISSQAIYTSGTLPEITTTTGDTPGTIAWQKYDSETDTWTDYDLSEITEDENYEFTWRFIPDDTETYNELTGTATFRIETVKPESIAIKNVPQSTEYYIGDEINLTGLVLELAYNDGTKETIIYNDSTKSNFTTDITQFTEVDEGIDEQGQNKTITITYTIDGKQLNTTLNLTVKPYKITYVLNGGTNNTNNKNYIYSLNAIALYDATAPTGYKFTGWYLNNTYAADKKVTTIDYNNKNVTLYAKMEVDETQTKQLSYTVEYYKDNVESEIDKQIKNIEVQVLQPNTMNVDKDSINIIDKYDGYILDKIKLNETTIEQLPDTINSGDVISVLYRTKLIENISIKTEPQKTNYYYDEELDIDDVIIVVIYEDGSTKEIPIYKDEDRDGLPDRDIEGNKILTDGLSISEYDKTMVGEQTITITYLENGKEKSTSLTVQVNKITPDIHPQYEKTEIIYTSQNLPDITTLEGDIPGTIKWQKYNAETNSWTDYDISNITQDGNYEITWRFVPDNTEKYNEITGTENFRIETVKAEKISVITNPNDNEYHIGDEIDLTGLVLELTNNDGSKKTIIYNDETKANITTNITQITELNDETDSEGQEITVTITYRADDDTQLNTAFDIIAKPYQITYVVNEGTNSQNNPTYITNIETINLAAPEFEYGYKFVGWYLDEEFTDQVSSINYLNKDTTVYAKIVVDETKTKDVTYTVQYYKNGNLTDTETITETIQVLEENIPVKAEKINTTNKYRGYILDRTEPSNIPTTVRDGGIIKVYYRINKITGIEITNDPEKTEYVKGEEILLGDGEITITYENGETKTISLDDENVEITGYNPDKTGKQTVTITYKEEGQDPISTTIVVTVTNDITNIEITKEPEKTEYVKGEPLDLTETEITITYENGEQKVIPIIIGKDEEENPIYLDGIQISDYDPNNIGEQEITISYTEGNETISTVIYIQVHKIKLTVHHYIQGTQERVPLSETGEFAKDEIREDGIYGTEYQTTPVTNIAPEYELVNVPDNQSGIYENRDIVVTYYYKLKEEEAELSTTITKERKGEGIDVTTITDTKTPIYYEIKYKTIIEKFIGKVELEIIDELPYNIDVHNSDLSNLPSDYTYIVGTEEETPKLIWKETRDVNTYREGIEGKVELNRTIPLTLKYIYPVDVTKINKKLINTASINAKLIKNNDTVKEKNDNASHEIEVKLPAKVIVEHYLYDAERNMETIYKLAEDEKIEGVINDAYETSPGRISGEASKRVPANYECINSTPEGYAGTMKKAETIVKYYYALKDETIKEDVIRKTANTGKTTTVITPTTVVGENGKIITQNIEEKLPVLTDEDGIVEYKIEYTFTIQDYIGKAEVLLEDKLPAKVSSKESLQESIKLDGGELNGTRDTITWRIPLTGIDTFSRGEYRQTITKTIKIAYENQDVTKNLVNTVKGKLKTYYPDTHPDITKAGKEKKTTEEKVDLSTVAQEYKVDRVVQSEWDDNENIKGKRPSSIKLQLIANGMTKLNGEDLPYVILSEENSGGESKIKSKSNTSKWYYTFKNLDKYDSTGRKIVYSVKVTEVNFHDLEYYESPEIEEVEGTNVILVKNAYKMLDTKLENSNIEKTGTEKITTSNQKIRYDISYTADINDYIGEASLNIIDELPYKIDLSKSDLNGGIYDENTKTIRWSPMLGENGHINTEENGTYEIRINKRLEITYKDDEYFNDLKTKNTITNRINGKLEFTQTEKKSELNDICNTEIDVRGKVIIKYVNKNTQEELTYEDAEGNIKTYGYEEEGRIGSKYLRNEKKIKGYTFVEDTGNTEGEITEGATYVTYYYEKDPGKLTVKYVDEDGNKIIDNEQSAQEIGTPYETTAKDFTEQGYEFVEVVGEEQGTYQEDEIVVVYHYKRIPAKVIVKYLEKETEKELAEEETINGYVTKPYETERKVIENYKKAEPEPQNSQGNMAKETITVVYYYEKIPSGKVIAKYVDIDTKEEIEKAEEDGTITTYKEEYSGYVGEKYETEEKIIPYYELLEEYTSSNRSGKYTEDNIIVTYYYRKLPFNMMIEKHLKEIIVNGEVQETKGAKLPKVEIKDKQIPSIDVIAKYEIIVKNTGKLEGKAIIEENIPEGYEVTEETAKEWNTSKNGTLNRELTLQSGEEKVLEVTLKWINGEENFGLKRNIAQIVKTSNEAGYEETSLEDNISESQMVITIKTGQNLRITMAHICMSVLCIYLSILLIDLYRQQNKKSA